ncbi:MAG: DUF4919 domain-containing protein [Prevotella sp.]|nr:DUF4919 domain-containing protein [Prevotella sp.]
MKKLISLIVLVLMAMTTRAQANSAEKMLMPVDWTAIKASVEQNPAHVKELVARLSADEPDTTLTQEERILAFYGQTYITNGRDMMDDIYMDEALQKGQSERAAAIAGRILAVNPLHLDAMLTKIKLYVQVAKEQPGKGWQYADSLKAFSRRSLLLYSTIAATGDGSKEHPFCVTSVGDEYCFLRYYLGIFKVKGQALADNCDVLYLGETSRWYHAKEIFFDITRVLELEKTAYRK